MKILSWILAVVAAVIFLQTLFFKFTGAPESVYIFETVGMEPWGRYGSGFAELIAAVLMLIPATRALGALFGVGVISGAVFFHLTKLGIVVQDDGGALFGMAIVVLLSTLGLLAIHRRQLVGFAARLRPAVA